MDQKFRRMLDAGALHACVLLFLYSAAGFFIHLLLGAAMAAGAVVCFFLLRRRAHQRSRELTRWLDGVQLQFEAARGGTVSRIPLPMALVRVESMELIWRNDAFTELDNRRESWFATGLGELLPDFDLDWLVRGGSEYEKPVRLGERMFRVRGSLATEARETQARLGALFFIDVTELALLRSEYQAGQLVTASVQLDNYDEISKNLSGDERGFFMAKVDAALGRWAGGADGILIKSERDKYMFVFERRCLDRLSRFDILGEVRGLEGSGSFPATLSIGIGCEGDNPAQTWHYARMALDMALSRGGDQAVIKNARDYSFFGGRTREIEQRTKVRARVMASAIRDMMSTAQNVLVMGHSYADMDCVGAGAGIVCAGRKLGCQINFVLNSHTSPAMPLVERLLRAPEYKNIFVEPGDAGELAGPGSLLIVVDVNRASFVEAPALLPKVGRVVVIDHHRRVTDFIESPTVSLHEPYASSASELVTELLQYIVQPADILRAEAESLLAGISLDTKNFTMKTGVRTFEAAAFLRRAGADTISVKQLFQSDMESNLLRSDILRTAVRYHDTIAIAYSAVNVNRIVGGQAADELLNISGIQASFVIFRCDGQTNISARSLGQINVQLIMERLGGGGSITDAGAQLGDRPVGDVADALRTALENYFTLV